MWARTCLRAVPRAGGTAALFGIVQAGVDPELRAGAAFVHRSPHSTSTDMASAGSPSAKRVTRCCSPSTPHTKKPSFARRLAVLPHGRGRRDRNRRRRSAWGIRHVRLRDADPNSPHRQRPDEKTAASTSGTPASLGTRVTARRRSASVRRAARFTSRLHPPPRQPERAPGPSPPLAPQSTLRRPTWAAARCDAVDRGQFDSYKRGILERIRCGCVPRLPRSSSSSSDSLWVFLLLLMQRSQNGGRMPLARCDAGFDRRRRRDHHRRRSPREVIAIDGDIAPIEIATESSPGSTAGRSPRSRGRSRSRPKTAANRRQKTPRQRRGNR